MKARSRGTSAFMFGGSWKRIGPGRGPRRPPVEQEVRARQPIERVVDLDGRKSPGVVAEHRVVPEIGRVERPFPLLEGEAARAGHQPHDALAFLCRLWGSSSSSLFAALASLRLCFRASDRKST